MNVGATHWTFRNGCYLRHDGATGERLAFVYPEPGTPEWYWEVAVGGALVIGEPVTPDTAKAAANAADSELRRRGVDVPALDDSLRWDDEPEER